MACSFDGPPRNKNTRCLSKASFIRGKQKDGFTSALFPPLGPWPGPFLPSSPPLSLPPAHTLTGSFQHGAVGVWGTPFMFTCVHAGLLCQTCPPHNRRAKRLTSSFWRGHPHSDMNEHGWKNTPAPLSLYVWGFTVNARGVCLLRVTARSGT